MEQYIASGVTGNRHTVKVLTTTDILIHTFFVHVELYIVAVVCTVQTKLYFINHNVTYIHTGECSRKTANLLKSFFAVYF